MIQGLFYNWIPWIYNRTASSLESVHRVILAIYFELTVRKEWLLLKNTSVPIYSLVFPTIHESTIRWRCETNPPRFTDTSDTSSEERHISYLGFSVNIPGYDTIDLTNWINTVRWSGPEEPSLLDLFTIWCCESGNSQFHALSDISVTVITETADTVTRGLMDPC